MDMVVTRVGKGRWQAVFSRAITAIAAAIAAAGVIRVRIEGFVDRPIRAAGTKGVNNRGIGAAAAAVVVVAALPLFATAFRGALLERMKARWRHRPNRFLRNRMVRSRNDASISTKKQIC